MSEKSVIIDNSNNIDSIEFNYNRTINIYSKTSNGRKCESVSIDSPAESFEVVINKPKNNDNSILYALLFALISVFMVDIFTHVNLN